MQHLNHVLITSISNISRLQGVMGPRRQSQRVCQPKKYFFFLLGPEWQYVTLSTPSMLLSQEDSLGTQHIGTCEEYNTLTEDSGVGSIELSRIATSGMEN